MIPSDKHKLIAARLWGLIFAVQHCFSPIGAFWHTTVHTIHLYGLKSVPFIFADRESVNFVIAHDGYFTIWRSLAFFIAATLITTVLDLNIADCKVSDDK